HDGGDVDIELFETSQQVGEAGAATDGDHIDIGHVRSKSVVGDNLRDRLPHGCQREYRSDHRVSQLPKPETEHGDTGNDEQQFAIRVRDELKCNGSDQT